MIKNHHPLYGVDEVTILEPCDNEILSQMMQSDNIYQQIVRIMKQSTQEYYNMRMVLKVKCN
jgi:hypothetical protein